MAAGDGIIEGPSVGKTQLELSNQKSSITTPANNATISGLGGAKAPINTPGGVTIPKLNIGGKDIRDKSGNKHKRQLSDSSRGSIGRKERLRNALTGSTDGRGDGADKPKELPKSELIDFLLQYDRTDPFCYKLIKKKV